MKKSERLASRLQKALCSVSEIVDLEKEVKQLRSERDRLLRNRGKYGSCRVESDFFGIHVLMGKKLRVTFSYHRGRPYLKIQTHQGVPPLKLALEEDGTLEVIE